MAGVLNAVLIALSVPLAAAAAFMLGLGLWDVFLGRMVGEVSEEKTTFVKALQTVILRTLGVLNRRFMWPRYEAKVRRKLITAGEPSGLRPEEVMAMQELGFLVALVLGLLALNAVDVNLAYALLVALVGLWYPRLWLSDQVKKRHHLITRALPYNLDLLTLSVEAGLDFTAALSKVVEKGKGGPLRD
jgi:tight adherence protein C